MLLAKIETELLRLFFGLPFRGDILALLLLASIDMLAAIALGMLASAAIAMWVSATCCRRQLR